LLDRKLDYLVQDARQDLPLRAQVTFEARLEEGGIYRISQDGRALGIDYDPIEAVSRLYRACYGHAYDILPAGVVFLHAASGGHQGQRFLLIGESGTGKTTMILHLARLGVGVEGDEIAVMMPDGITALPRRFHVKSESLSQLPWLRAIAEASPLHDNRDGSLIFAVSPRQLGVDWTTRPGPIDAVFYLEANHGGQPRVEEMARTRMVELAIQQARLTARQDRSWLGPLCAVLNRAAAYKLIVGNLDKTAQILLRTLSEGTGLARRQPW
jgi:energy-coupling factor transporter ATP-binding protein EcfA2